MSPLKRWFRAAFIAGVLMLLDGVALIGVSRALGPRPPGWATGPFFWSLAWPVQLLANVFPNTAAGDKGPSMVAVACGALVDLVLFAIIVDWALRRFRRA
jgi:hypothetical protein